MGALEDAEDRSARPEPQGHRVLGALSAKPRATDRSTRALMQRTKETGISGELKTSNIRVVDAAEIPSAPLLPQRQHDLMLAASPDRSSRSAWCSCSSTSTTGSSRRRSCARTSACRSSAWCPAIDSAGPTLLHDGVPPAFAEAIRAVRTNVLFSSADEGVRMIVVTSAGPGEGKSMFSSNLSVSLAQAGQRVLHIDADMRRPRVHEIFELPQEPGLSNLLVGDCKPSEAVKMTGVQNLCVLPAGMIPPNPAELIGSKRCSEYFATLERALRLGDHRLAARARRGRRVDSRESGHRRPLRRRRRSDQPPDGEGRRRSAPRRAGPRDRRGAEPGGRRAEPLLLLDLLPQGVRPVLREGVRPPSSVAPSPQPPSRTDHAPGAADGSTGASGFSDDASQTCGSRYLSGSGAMGGAERVLLDLILGMQARGHQIKLILGEAGPLQSQVACAGVEAEVLPMPERLAAFGESGQSPAAMLAGVPAAGAAALWYLRALDAAVARWNPSLIHSNAIKTHVLGARLRHSAPLVWHLHDYVGSRPLTARLLRWHRGAARGAIANSVSVATRREGDAAGPADLDGAKRGGARSVPARRGPGGSGRAEPPPSLAGRNDSYRSDCDLRVVERP